MESYVDSTMHERTKHGTADFPIGIYGDSYEVYKDRFYYTHYHEELEIIYAKLGEIDIIVNETKYHLNQNQSILISSNAIHKICHDGYPESRVYTIVFSKNLIEFNKLSIIQTNIIDQVMKSKFEAVQLKKGDINSNIYRIITASGSKHKGYELDIAIEMLNVLRYIYRNYDTLNPIESKSKNNERIKEALAYIQKNYANQITLKQLAEVCYLSEGETSRLFKKYLGQSPIDYLISYRIKIASSYLVSSNLSITEIAYTTGFSSSNYFTIAFKKITGLTPKEFRKKR